MNEIIIGIDLGTTNSEVAIVEQGQAKIIADGVKKILPSFVGIDDNGDIIVGDTARNQYLAYPERTIKSIKRIMGENIQLTLAGQDYSPQEISAIIIKRLKAIAEEYLGQAVSKAVITVPAYFSDSQRQATREAGEIAGLEIVRIINEPTAAALAYDASHAEQQHMLVYDLGGGTFDVSVVNIEAGVIEVLSSHGDNHLGGDDFDQQIIEYLLNHLKSTHAVDVSKNSKAMARLSRAAENAKHLLSTQPYVQIDEEYLLEDNGLAIHLSIELSRMAYEEMIEKYISATMEAIHIALKGAKLTPSDIDEIVLVGGSTRTPCIRERLANEFGFQPHDEIDADLCVTLGAAIQAAMMSGQQVDKVLVDVTPYSYGTSAIGTLNGESYPFMYVPIIHKNSVLPSDKSDAFVSSYDGQESIDVTIYQGEDSDALNNVKIAEFKVTGLQKVKAGNVITLTLSLDLNGILHVTALEKATGLEKSVTISNALSSFESSSIENAKQRISSLFGKLDASLYEHAVPAEIEAAQTLIIRTEAIFDTLSSEDKDQLLDLMKTIANDIETKNIAALLITTAKLNEVIDYIES